MITLRPAALTDAELLRAWRNDPEMRKNSFHSSIVEKQEHIRWLKASLKSKTRRIYIAQDDSILIGQGRLDFNGNAIEFDIEVAPEYRVLGYGCQILAALVLKAREWKPDIPLVAHVKAFNTPSLRMFLGAGFAMRGNQCLTLERR